MIENDKQLAVTHRAVRKLEGGLGEAESAGPRKGVAPEIYLAELQALHQQIADLHEELAAYYRQRLARKFKVSEFADKG